MRIGIIGQGFVGSAVKAGMEHNMHVHTFDLDASKRNCESMEELVNLVGTDWPIFLCLPTPMKKDGSCDLSILNRVLSYLDSLVKGLQTVIIKSTIPPGTTSLLNATYEKLNVVFNPEFLTEANAINDYINQDRILLGGNVNENTAKVFTDTFSNVPLIISGNPSIMEMVKYVTNTFLAVKVSYANEISDICKVIGIDYNEMINVAKFDKRLGNSHWSVPGPDGKKGYSGSCFPKDINALISLANTKGLDAKVLKASWFRNVNIDRTEQDWNDLLGRAISME